VVANEQLLRATGERTLTVILPIRCSEGQGRGLPAYSHPHSFSIVIVFCAMTCLKACPNRWLQLNLALSPRSCWRITGIPGLSGPPVVAFGRCTDATSERNLSAFGFPAVRFDASIFGARRDCTALASLSGLWRLLAHAIGAAFVPPASLSHGYFAYLSFSPWAINLAHYVPAAMTEAGKMCRFLPAALDFADWYVPISHLGA